MMDVHRHAKPPPKPRYAGTHLPRLPTPKLQPPPVRYSTVPQVSGHCKYIFLMAMAVEMLLRTFAEETLLDGPYVMRWYECMMASCHTW